MNQPTVHTGPNGTYFVEEGTGTVLSVDPCDYDLTTQTHRRAQVRIRLDREHGQPTIVEYSITPTIPADSPMRATAVDAMLGHYRVNFRTEWHRKSYVPAGIPIHAVNLSNNGDNVLTNLTLVEEHVMTEADFEALLRNGV